MGCLEEIKYEIISKLKRVNALRDIFKNYDAEGNKPRKKSKTGKRINSNSNIEEINSNNEEKEKIYIGITLGKTLKK